MTVTFHVGYHKTATSWMQTQLFQPEHGFRQIASHDEVFHMLVAPDAFRFTGASFRTLIEDRLARLPEGETPIVSSEIMSGHPYDGNRGGAETAHRLKSLFADARILISIRRQLSILPSVYMHYLRFGGTLPWEAFFAGPTEIEHYGFAPEHFEYDRLVGLYQELFGADRVHVVSQEGMAKDLEGTAAGIAAFVGNAAYRELSAEARKVHSPSYPEYAASVLRRLNHFQKSPLHPRPVLGLGTSPKGPYRTVGYILRRAPFLTLLDHRRPVTAHVRQRFSGYYRDSNARLEGLLPASVDLSAYD